MLKLLLLYDTPTFKDKFLPSCWVTGLCWRSWYTALLLMISLQRTMLCWHAHWSRNKMTVYAKYQFLTSEHISYKFPCCTLYSSSVFFSSLVWRKRALVNQQRDTDPWAQHLLTSQPPIQLWLEAWATEKPNPAWQGLNNRFLPHPGPHS